MSNNMNDLREVVAKRLRETLHGKEIDMIESVKPRTPHMLGITEPGEKHYMGREQDTILDPEHQFWERYDPSITSSNVSVETRGDVLVEIETAIRSLSESGVLTIEYPYGENAGIAYVEVDKIDTSTDDSLNLETKCKSCKNQVTAQPSLALQSNSYNLHISIACERCGFNGVYETALVRK